MIETAEQVGFRYRFLKEQTSIKSFNFDYSVFYSSNST